jgi:hypothetical protein
MPVFFNFKISSLNFLIFPTSSPFSLTYLFIPSFVPFCFICALPDHLYFLDQTAPNPLSPPYMSPGLLCI